MKAAERKRRTKPAPAAINATAIYERAEAAKLLRMHPQTLTREVRAGRLRHKVDRRRWLFQGQWLLDWLAA